MIGWHLREVRGFVAWCDQAMLVGEERGDAIASRNFE